MTDYYFYDEIYAAVLDDMENQEKIKRLVKWLEDYDPNSWNGEYYQAHDLKILPVYDIPEDGDPVLIKYEVSYI